jgi:hypothetical protein
MNNTGRHASCGSTTTARADATARSMRPSLQSSLKNVGMNSAMVAMRTLPCMASTAGTPASANCGPSATRALASPARAACSAPAPSQLASTMSRGRCSKSSIAITRSAPRTGLVFPCSFVRNSVDCP